MISEAKEINKVLEIRSDSVPSQPPVLTTQTPFSSPKGAPPSFAAAVSPQLMLVLCDAVSRVPQPFSGELGQCRVSYYSAH